MLQASLLLALATVASARKCIDALVDVSLTSRNAILNLEPLTTEIDVANFYLEVAKQGRNYTDSILEGARNPQDHSYTTIEGDYQLATTYCEPDSGPGDVLQIMTHGIAFDRHYWDLPFNDYNYSYVARAVDEHGYSTLTWDRLGVGESSKGDTISEIQVFLEIAALRELTVRMAEGRLWGNITHAYDTIVHLGHSFGSAMTYNLVNMYPDISDGIVLTGFSQVPGYMAHFDLGTNFAPVSSIPTLADKYPEGYIGPGSKIGVHIGFFAPGDFDPAILDYAFETVQGNTPAEIATVGSGGGLTNVFHGPSMVITGERDVPFCGGNCFGTSLVNNTVPNLPAASEQFFPNASAFNATVVLGAGHGLNMGYSHVSTYNQILDFLNNNL